MVHPAGSWCPLFTAEPLVPGGFPRHQDQRCPTRGAKMGEGLQLRTAKSTRVPGHDHRGETINYDHRRLHFPPPRVALTWAASLSSPPPPSDSGSPRRAKDEAPRASESSSFQQARVSGREIQKSAWSILSKTKEWGRRETRERDAGGGDGGGREEE